MRVKGNKIIAILMITLVLFSIVTPRSAFAYPDNETDFYNYIKDLGYQVTLPDGKKANWIVYRDYNVIVWGSPHGSYKSDSLCGNSGEYQDLGYNNRSQDVTNMCYPNDATSGTHPKYWNYITVDGASTSWQQIKDSNVKSQIKNSSWTGNGATASDPLYYSNIGSEDKVKVEVPPTWRGKGSVYTRNRGKNGKVYYATFIVPAMAGANNAIVDGSFTTDKDTYTIDTDMDKVTVNYNVIANAKISGYMSYSDISALTATYKSASKTTAGQASSTLQSTFDLTRSSYKPGTYTLNLEGNVSVKTKFGDSESKKVFKTITLVVKASTKPIMSATGSTNPSTKTFDAGTTVTDVPVQVTVNGALSGVDPSKITKYQLLARKQEDKTDTLKEFTGTAAQKLTQSNMFNFTISSTKIGTTEYTQNFAISAKAYLNDGNVITGSTTVITTVIPPGATPPAPPPTVDPGPSNEPPTVTIFGPTIARAGDNVFLSSNPQDVDGTIVSQSWSIPGATGDIAGTSGSIIYPFEGNYTESTTVTDDQGATGSDIHQITVTPPYPHAYFDVNGALKENRKVELTDRTDTPVLYPIDWSKSYWTITANDPTEQGDIKYIGNLSGDTSNVIDSLYKKSGDYTVKLFVTNTAGYSDSYQRVIHIDSDQAPVADFSTVTTIYRDNVNNDNATIQLTDASYSPDDDLIKQRIWKYKFDSNNNGSFDDEQWQTIDDTNLEAPSFEVSHVGKYLIEEEVVEDFGQETIPQFISDSDYKTGNTDNKPIAEKVVEVKNLAPVVSFDVGKRKTVNLQVSLGYTSAVTDINALTTKINSIIKPSLSADNIDLDLSVENTSFEKNPANVPPIDTQLGCTPPPDGYIYDQQIVAPSGYINNINLDYTNYSYYVIAAANTQNLRWCTWRSNGYTTIDDQGYLPDGTNQIEGGGLPATFNVYKKNRTKVPFKITKKDNESGFAVLIHDKQLSTTEHDMILGNLQTSGATFIGLGTTSNQSQMQDLINSNSYNGTYYDNSNIDSDLQQISDYIIQKLDRTNIDVDLAVGDSAVSQDVITSKFNAIVLPKLNDAGIDVTTLKTTQGVFNSNSSVWNNSYNYPGINDSTHYQPTINYSYPLNDGKVYFVVSYSKYYGEGQNHYSLQLFDGVTNSVKIIDDDIPQGYGQQAFVIDNQGNMYFSSSVGFTKYNPHTDSKTVLVPNASLNMTYDIPANFKLDSNRNIIYYFSTYSATNYLCKLDLTTNTIQRTLIANLPNIAGNLGYYYGINVNSDGNLIVSDNVFNQYYKIDVTNNSATPLTNLTGVRSLNYDSTSNIFAYVTNSGNINVSNNGSVSTIATVPSGVYSNTFATLSHNGQYVYISTYDTISAKYTSYRLNLKTNAKDTYFSPISSYYEYAGKISVSLDDSKISWPSHHVLDVQSLSIPNVFNVNPTGNQHFAAIFENNAFNSSGLSVVTSKLPSLNVDLIGVGNSTNQSQINTLISANNNVGTFLDGTDIDTAMNQLGDYIIKEVNAKIDQKVIYITTDDVANYFPYFNDTEGDPKYTLSGNTGENWRYVHDSSVFENSNGTAPFNNQNLTTPITKFDRVGKYNVYYSARDNPVGTEDHFDNYRMWSQDTNYTIYVHRKPVANFNFTLNKSTGDYTLTNAGYDLDKYSINIGNGPGLQGLSYQWRVTGTDLWQDGLPPSPLAKASYDIQQTVLDFQGATQSIIKTIDATGINQPPVADFSNPDTVVQGTNVTFKNLSYDPNGDTLTAQWWISPKGKNTFTSMSTVFEPTQIMNTIGDFDVKLRVTDPQGAYDEVTKSITVVNKNLPPKAGFTCQNPYFIGDTMIFQSTATDPENDPLTYTYTVKKPDGTTTTYNSGDPQVNGNGDLTLVANNHNTDLGNWEISQQVSDGQYTDTATASVTVLDQTIKGAVSHTPKWDQNRQQYNLEKSGTPDNPRGPSVFFPGEKFMLNANGTQTATKVEVKILEYPQFDTTLTKVGGSWEGDLWDPSMIDLFTNEPLTFEFIATYANGWISEDQEQVQIEDDQYWRQHTLF
ncbi:MAG: hypothetical protein Q8934_08960 [Bacillota bacterium]|nr:hypothetical protein [Bacillota bacterium]